MYLSKSQWIHDRVIMFETKCREHLKKRQWNDGFFKTKVHLTFILKICLYFKIGNALTQLQIYLSVKSLTYRITGSNRWICNFDTCCQISLCKSCTNVHSYQQSLSKDRFPTSSDTNDYQNVFIFANLEDNKWYLNMFRCVLTSLVSKVTLCFLHWGASILLFC